MPTINRNTMERITFKLLKIIKELLYGKLGTWNIYPVDFELKQDVKPMCSRPYTVPKVYKVLFKIIRLFGYNGSP